MGFFNFLKPKPKLPQLSPELERMMQQVALAAFPGGPKQIREETLQLHALLRGRLSQDEAGRLLRKTKAMLVTSDDKSEERIIQSVLFTTSNKLTRQEARLVYIFLTGVAGSPYSGGDGSTPEKAVVINATSTMAGIDLEYSWLEKRFGKREVDWNVGMRSHGTYQNGKSFEQFEVILINGEKHTIYFDISLFYGRF